MHRQQYFRYYETVTPPLMRQEQNMANLSESRPKTSQYSVIKTKKILPHIMEEYQYNITNELLEKKIKNPRRDKIIISSLANPNKNKDKIIKRKRKRFIQNRQSQHCALKSTVKTQQAARSNDKENHLLWLRKPQLQKHYKTFHDMNSSCNNYKNDYLLNLENKRMGKRLINTRSMVQDYLEKTFFTYQVYNGKLTNKDKFVKIQRDSARFRNGNKSFGKMNSGIKRFFHTSKKQSMHKSVNNLINSSHLQTENILGMQTFSHGYQTNVPNTLQVCGKGQLNLIIKRLQFFSNPALKPDSILTIQLYQSIQDLTSILHQNYNRQSTIYEDDEALKIEKKQRKVKTLNFPYQYMISAKQAQFGLKFKFQYHQNIILRFLKIDGLRQNELGMIKLDLNLLNIKNDQMMNKSPIKQRKHNQINAKSRQQNIFESNLHRYKRGEISTRVKLQYQLFYDEALDSNNSRYS